MKNFIFILLFSISISCVSGQVFIAENQFVLADGTGPIIKVFDFPKGSLNKIIPVDEIVYYMKYNETTDKIYAMGPERIMSINPETKEFTVTRVHTSNPQIMYTPLGVNTRGIALYKVMDMTSPASIKNSLQIYDCHNNKLLREVDFNGTYALVEEDGYIGEFDLTIQKRSFETGEVLSEYYNIPNEYQNLIKTTNARPSLVNMGKYFVVAYNKNATNFNMVYIEKSSAQEAYNEERNSFPNALYSIFYMNSKIPMIGIPKTRLGSMPSAADAAKYQKWLQDRMNPDNNYIEVYEDIKQSKSIKELDKTNGMTFVNDKIAMVVTKVSYELIDTKTWETVCSIDRF